LIATDIYSAGEEPIPGVTGEIIYQAAFQHGCQALYLANPDLILNYLYEEALPGDIIVFMGAGDIWKTGERLKRILEDSNPPA
jgi:UDP-N-acetylmuramate--alanine ligase